MWTNNNSIWTTIDINLVVFYIYSFSSFLPAFIIVKSKLLVFLLREMSILIVETSIKVNKLLKTEKFSSVGALDIFNSLSL